MNSTQEISFSSPIRFPGGKHDDENLHWLGRCVEPFFDFGQQGYVVHNTLTDDGAVAIDKDTRKLSKGQIALKVFTTALKIIAIATIIIPLVMLIGKLIYRSSNYFDIIPRPEIDQTMQKAEALIDRYQINGAAYGDILDQLDIYESEMPAKETLDETLKLNRKINTALAELEQATTSQQQKLLPKNHLKQLEKAKEGITELYERFSALLTDPTRKAKIAEALDAMKQDAEYDLNDYMNENEAWTTAQTAILDKVKSRRDSSINKEIHQELCKATRRFEVKDYPAIEKYRSAVDALDHILPKQFTSEEIKQLNKEIDKTFKPVGIPNLGNSCYMNALLQTLSASPGFYRLVNTPIEVLLPTTPDDVAEVCEQFPVVDALDLTAPRRPGERHRNANERSITDLPTATKRRNAAPAGLTQTQIQLKARKLQDSLRLFFLAHRSKNKTAIRIAAYGFRERMIEAGIIPSRERTRQQDSSEFMVKILEKLNCPMLEVEEVKTYTDTEAVGYVNAQAAPQGMLSIPIKDDDGRIISNNFQGLVDTHFAPSQQEGELSINGNEVAPHTWEETTQLTVVPDTIALSLKRFDNHGNKISGQIALPFDNVVDLRKAFADGVIKEGDSTLYQITSVIQHVGGTSGGHYTANVYRDGSWHQCNDSSVTAPSRCVGTNGYVFVLKRI